MCDVTGDRRTPAMSLNFGVYSDSIQMIILPINQLEEKFSN